MGRMMLPRRVLRESQIRGSINSFSSVTSLSSTTSVNEEHPCSSLVLLPIRTGEAAETHRSLTIFSQIRPHEKMKPDHRAMIGVSVQLSVGLGSPLPVVIRLRKLSLM